MLISAIYSCVPWKIICKITTNDQLSCNFLAWSSFDLLALLNICSGKQSNGRAWHQAPGELLSFVSTSSLYLVKHKTEIKQNQNLKIAQFSLKQSHFYHKRKCRKCNNLIYAYFNCSWHPKQWRGGTTQGSQPSLSPLIKAHDCSSFGRIFSWQMLVSIFLIYSKET